MTAGACSPSAPQRRPSPVSLFPSKTLNAMYSAQLGFPSPRWLAGAAHSLFALGRQGKPPPGELAHML